MPSEIRIYATRCLAMALMAVISAQMPVRAVSPSGADSQTEAGHPRHIGYEAEALMNAGSGDFAPYYIASNRHGILTQKSDALLRLSAIKPLDNKGRWDYGFGIETLTGYSASTPYMRFDPSDNSFYTHRCSPPAIWLQQLYGELRYRGVFLTVGMKQHESALLNFALSSGDLTESGNSRPIPEVRAGFIDFRDIPLTDGWVQIQGEISYGKFADNGWLKDHYNYYSYHINLGGLYTYKRCYFRTKPSQPFSVTVGMQVACSFGGTTSSYINGKLTEQKKHPQSLETFFKMLLPIRGEGSEYYEGSTLGSWDFVARYRLANGATLKAYVEKPWEDGSGIGWQNGFDGVWGVEYSAADRQSIVSGAVVEYLDFTNQSGPIHWYDGDFPGTDINHHSNGADSYYNNYTSNSYAYYGMSIGTPFLRSPLYNTDGYPGFVDSRVRGFHIGLTGNIAHGIGYRLLGGYRKGWGDGVRPTATSREDTSVMLEADYRVTSVDGLKVKAQLALDRGNMYGDNFGACLTVSYRGAINF